MKLSFQMYLTFGVVLCCWHTATFVLGVFIADYFDVSETGFDFKSDIKKAAVCSFLALTPTMLIFYYAPNMQVLIIYLVVLVFSGKVAYLGTNNAALVIVMGTNLVGLIVFRYVIGILTFTGVYVFIFLAVTVLMVMQVKQKRSEKKMSLEDKHNEQRIRNMARLHPDFHTHCHECKHFNSKFSQCQRKLDKRSVKDIQINAQTYCAHWESINS